MLLNNKNALLPSRNPFLHCVFRTFYLSVVVLFHLFVDLPLSAIIVPSPVAKISFYF